MISNPHNIEVACYERLAAMIECIVDAAEMSRDGWATSRGGEYDGWVANADGFRWSEEGMQTVPWMDGSNSWADGILSLWEGDDWVPNKPMSALEKLAEVLE